MCSTVRNAVTFASGLVVSTRMSGATGTCDSSDYFFWD